MRIHQLALSLIICLLLQQTPTIEASTFSDVKTNDWFASYVEQLATAGIISTANSNFFPHRSISRGELAKMAVRAAQYQGLIANERHESQQSFCDVHPSNVFHAYIETLAEKGVVNGINTTCAQGKNFLPFNPVSRAEALKILLGIYSITSSSTSRSQFHDVTSTEWHSRYIAKAVSIGLVNGYGDGSFRPNGFLSRAEMSKILSLLMNFHDNDSEPTTSSSQSPSPSPSPSQPAASTPPSNPPATQATSGDLTYNIGTPTVQHVWVSPNGNDDNNGSQSSPFASIAKALSLIPENTVLSTGYHIHVLAGTYGPETMPNYPENLFGTQQTPIIIQGEGNVQINGNLNIYNVKYFYLINLKLKSNHDVVHFEKSDHILLRGITLRNENRSAQETLKINQSQHIYIEDSDISGANDNAIDFVAVQYGHTVRSRIHDAEDWCMYVKGGSAYYRVENNEFYGCGTGGFTAGQGTGFEFMTLPWIHYEAYDIRVVNNIFHDIEGAGLGVNGGYNILMAHNTMYKVGSRDHVIEVVFGGHGCDGNTTECQKRVTQGGWGTAAQEDFAIGNKHVMIYNNIVYNPAGFVTAQWPENFAIHGPRTNPAGSNGPNPVLGDEDLQIKGNIIWSTGNLGVSGENGCHTINPTCNPAQLMRDNFINTIELQFVDAAGGNFKLRNTSTIVSSQAFPLPQLSWNDAPTRPRVPAGTTTNIPFIKYRDGTTATTPHPGAY